MSLRSELSRDRLYRSMSLCLALATAFLLIPPEWISMLRESERPREPIPRPVEIIRVPPETLPEPPPLPPLPEMKPEPEPKPLPEPEPITKTNEPVSLRLKEPEIVIPRASEKLSQVDFEKLSQVDSDTAKASEVFRRALDEAEVELPTQTTVPQELPVVTTDRPTRLERNQEEVEVRVPKAVPRTRETTDIRIAAASERSYVDHEAPDVAVVTPRPAARPSSMPSLQPVSQQLRTGVAIEQADNAPAVDIPRGNTARPSKSAPVAVSGAVTGTKVVYDDHPGDAREVAVASPRASAGAGAAPKLAASQGGAHGLEYSAAPVGTLPGSATARRTTTGDARLEGVRSALSRKYGLPLVSVSSLGQRSTEAARWNLLLPEISDLLRRARNLGEWSGGRAGEIAAVKRDGKNVIIHYRDGVVHVLVPTAEGLASLFVARTSGAREIVSKVQEAEHARRALYRYTRGLP